ncbi:MAG: system, lactose/cellobiose family subunit [Firmicutes bacterium]|nr:system, lactose/cellobiose family subunit [Bacillota bacterium]
MNNLVVRIEKCKPFFEKMSNNSYLRAIRDGFISLIPVILFSSLFLLIAFVPNIFGFFWSDKVTGTLMKAYNFSMGIFAVLMSATVSKSLVENFNTKIKDKMKKINPVSAMVAAIIAFFLLSAEEINGGIAMTFFGSKGLITSFIVAFIVANIYRFCVVNNITIKMPKEVPGNIAQTFADLIPIAISIVVFWFFDFAFREVARMGFSNWILEIFKPLFQAADGYLGISIIFGAMAFFWFIGIHGPSIVEPAVSAVYIANVEANFMMFQAGEHATNVLSQGSQYFVATLGGTGATLVPMLMCFFFAKSMQLKAIGKASSIPVMFGINEPILFGMPLVLNPVFFIPFILAPIANVCLLRFFIQNLQMNGFIYNLPWTTPGPVGLVLGTGFAPLAFFLAVLLLVVDFVIYYPFFKTYDNSLVEREADQTTEEVEAVKVLAEEVKMVNVDVTSDEKYSVLVLCANGATSGMLANAIAKGAKERSVNIESTAMAYGQHKEIISDFDLIILAPQMSSMLEELEEDTARYNVKAASTSGAVYVKLTRDPVGALEFALGKIKEVS